MNDATRIVVLAGLRAVPILIDDDFFVVGAEGELVIFGEDSEPVAVYDDWTYGRIQ